MLAFLKTKLTTVGATSNREQIKDQKRRLRSFLGISDQLEDDHTDFDEIRTEGSCEWLTRKQGFTHWRDGEDTRVFWLSGNPATGKSFLAAYVVDHLKNLNAASSYYFFKEGDKVKSVLSKCFLSLAYQTALTNVSIRENFLAMDEDDIQLDKEDYRAIWRRLFVGGILQQSLYHSHYWVLDALDECKNYVHLIPLLAKIEASVPIRIFITTRPSLELQGRLQQTSMGLEYQQILPQDTIEDIKLYVEENLDCLNTEDGSGPRQQLITTILEKSEGCFLWVRLVLGELRNVYSTAETQKILGDVPLGMDQLYSRTLATMSMASYGKDLARAILIWTICSVRPLTIAELKHALELDVADTVHSLEKQIASSCGHLIYVDSQSKVQMVHQTARNFLIRPDTISEFSFHEGDGHRRLAKVCLRYLTSEEMRAPRARRHSTARLIIERSPFLDYAATSFYEHIGRSSSAEQIMFGLIHSFLHSSNVTSWIEYVAQTGDLGHMIRTGTVLQTYLKRRAKHFSPLGKEVQVVDLWATDLIRVVAKFGHNLLRFPPSIYHLVPPFCPREAAPYRQFGVSARGIAVVGLSTTVWDDRLACIAHRKGRTSAVACSDSIFAVGASNGLVTTYHTATCQEIGKMEHGELVKSLEFNSSGRLLASAGRKSIQVWEVTTRTLVWRFDTSHQSIALLFTSNSKHLVTACRDNHVLSYDLITGERVKKEPWHMDSGPSSRISQAPDTAAFSLELNLLAFVYRGSAINLWNWTSGEFFGVCENSAVKKGNRAFSAVSLVFNPAANTSLLAAAFYDGELVLFDPLEGDVKETCKADALTLACSPDGRTLAGGDSSGVIKLFDFETLKLLHIISGRDQAIRAMAFCGNNLRFVDTRGSQINVWEPAVLVRQYEDEETSDTLSNTLKEVGTPEMHEIDMITAIACDSRGEHVYCGTENGSVSMFEISTGKEHQKLYKHIDGISVTELVFDEKERNIASADSSGKVLVYQLKSASGQTVSCLLLECRTKETIHQVLFSPNSSRVLVSSANEDTLYALDGSIKKPISRAGASRRVWTWANHPQHPNLLILIVQNSFWIYEWEDLKNLSGGSGTHMDFEVSSDLEIKQSYSCWHGQRLATEFREINRSRSRMCLLLWRSSDFDISTSSTSPQPTLQPLADRLANLIGTFGTMIGIVRDAILFLDQDGWICSVEMEESEPEYYKRHFFLPFDWLITNEDLLFGATGKGDVVFSRKDELAVIKRGLECVELVPFEQKPD